MKELRFHGEKIVEGKGSIDYLHKIECQKAFIVTGKSAMFKNGTIQKIQGILEGRNKEVEIHSGVPANPTVEDIAKGLEKMKEYKPDTIIAVGGGSAIDASKVMTIFYDDPTLVLEDIQHIQLPQKRTRTQFIAIPSTSGTASEVTWSSVVTFKENNLKVGVKTPAFVPDIAILDGSITLSMPPHVVAETGMDAITHAVECYINKNDDDFTMVLCKGAVEGLFEYLPQSYKVGDEESRQKVHNYQSMAGSAFTNAGLGMAHGIAHAIGGMFDLGHGQINAILLPYVLEYNAQDPEVEEKLHHLAYIIGEKDFIVAVRSLNKALNIPPSFRDVGISQDEFSKNIDELVENSLKGSTRANPVKISAEDMRALLWKTFEGK